jgi:8-oxo-dGTP pyrophosphatase MutT (NUDIX family)
MTPMIGTTLQDQKPLPSPYAKKLADEEIENPNATFYRNKYYVSAFCNMSVSAAGLLYYVDQKTGKTFTLLERRKKDSYQWIFPAGYMEVYPPNVDEIIEDRLNEEERYAIEENTVGNNVGKLNKNIKYDQKISFTNLPGSQDLKSIIISEFEKMIHKEGWQKASKVLNNPDLLLKLLENHNIKWPSNIDVNWNHTWQREVLEETGVDIHQYKNRITIQLKPNATLVLGAGGERLTNADGRFCTFLGVLNEAPKVIPNYEMADAKWIALQDIYFDEKQERYIVPDDQRPIYPYGIVLIEESLYELLCYKIQLLTKYKNYYSGQDISAFDNPHNLQNFLVRNIKENYDLEKLTNINYIIGQKFGELYMLETLLGTIGRKLYRSFLAIAYYLSNHNLSSFEDFVKLDNFITEIINNPIPLYQKISNYELL